MKTKRCSRCKKMKPLTDFSVNRRNKSGRMCACKACYSGTRKQYYRDNRTKCKAAARVYYEAHRERYAALRKAYWTEHCEAMKAYNKARYRRLVRTPRIIAELEAAGYTVIPPKPGKTTAREAERVTR